MEKGVQLIADYFPEITSLQRAQFEKAALLYAEWNEKINLVSRKDISFLYERHFVHSLAIARFIRFKNNTKVLDAGTGGGFPGIPLAILFPACRFCLADSIGKKIKAVQGIITELNLENAVAVQSRVEQLDQKFDFVVSRAVTQLPELLKWVKGKINPESFNDLPNGVLCLKGGNLEKELSELKSKTKVVEIKQFFKEEFFSEKKLVYITSAAKAI